MKILWPIALPVLVMAAATASAGAPQQADRCLQDARQAVEQQQLSRAEAILQTHVQQHTADPDSRFLLARVQAWQNQHGQALAAFDRLIDEQPDNSDFLLARARLHQWMGHPRLALADLQQARQATPDYLALWQQELQLLAQSEQNPAAFRKLLEQARQRFPQADWQPFLPAKPAAAPTGKYTLAASTAYDRLDSNRDAWQQTSLSLSGRTTQGSGYVQVDSFERFSLGDWQLAGGISMPLAPRWQLALSASLGPGARVIARNRVEAVFSKQFDGGFSLHSGVQFASFAATASQQLHVTGEVYWSRYRFAWTYRLIDVDNAGTGHNQRAVLSRSYGAASTVSLSLATGKDVEYDGSATPPVSDVSTVSLYGRHALQADMDFTWSVLHHKQGSFYNRNGFVLGAQFHF